VTQRTGTLEENVSGASAGELEETIVAVSDQHLGEGLTLRYRRRYGVLRTVWRWIIGLFIKIDPPPIEERPNPLEDFPYDGMFAAFVDKIVEKYGGSDVLRLMLLGDCFDPLAVAFFGKFADPRTEGAAAYKMKKIIRGHPGYFDALAKALRLPNVVIDVFVGNHDLFLVWPAVQKLIIDRVAGDDPGLRSKMRFVDQRMRFELVHRGVLYYHGMNSEPQNAVDPDNVFSDTAFGIRRKRRLLNLPPGSVMTTKVVNSIKLRNFLVGRTTQPGMTWKNAALHRWGWLPFAGARLFYFFITWTFQAADRLHITFRMILSTIYDDSVDRLAEKMLAAREGIRAVVMGHQHDAKRVTNERGTYVNTGHWALTYRIVDPKFQYAWKRFRWLEFQVRAIEHFLRTGEIPVARQLTKLIGAAAFFSAVAVFLLTTIPKAWSLGAFHVRDLKLPLGILALFLFLSFLIKLFAGKPKIEQVIRPTFGLVRHFRNGDLKVELMEFDHQENAIRECV
jgi:UDP-2,3-diacylglucosamine pyrophosphatase LpxH